MTTAREKALLCKEFNNSQLKWNTWRTNLDPLIAFKGWSRTLERRCTPLEPPPCLLSPLSPSAGVLVLLLVCVISTNQPTNHVHHNLPQKAGRTCPPAESAPLGLHLLAGACHAMHHAHSPSRAIEILRICSTCTVPSRVIHIYLRNNTKKKYKN